MNIIRYNNDILTTLDDLKDEQFDNQSVISLLKELSEEYNDCKITYIS